MLSDLRESCRKFQCMFRRMHCLGMMQFSLLEYAEIPYDKLWDEEVLTGKLKGYDGFICINEDFWEIWKFLLLTDHHRRSYAKVMSRLLPSWLTVKYLSWNCSRKKLKEYVLTAGFYFNMLLRRYLWYCTCSRIPDIWSYVWRRSGRPWNKQQNLIFRNA